MSDDKITSHAMPNQPINEHGDYEREDLSSSSVMYFMAGLAVVVVVITLIVFGMYRFLNTYQAAHQPPMSPMVTAPADTRAVTPEDTQAFPQPRLEKNEGTDLQHDIEDQDRKLASYDWVDQNKGIVRIPINRAMELIAERGLPVRPENARPENARPEGLPGPQSSAPATKQSPKATGRKPAASAN